MSKGKTAVPTKEAAHRSWMVRIGDEKMAEIRTFIEDKGVEPSFLRRSIEKSLDNIDIQTSYDKLAYGSRRISAEEAADGIANVMESLARHLSGECVCEDDEDHGDAEDEQQANEELEELAVEAEQDGENLSLDPESEIR